MKNKKFIKVKDNDFKIIIIILLYVIFNSLMFMGIAFFIVYMKLNWVIQIFLVIVFGTYMYYKINNFRDRIFQDKTKKEAEK